GKFLELQCAFHKLSCLRGFAEVSLASESRKPLHVFKRVLLDAGDDSFLYNLMEVNKFFFPKQIVQFLVEDSVAVRESLDCRGFVCAVVIYRKTRIFL